MTWKNVVKVECDICGKIEEFDTPENDHEDVIASGWCSWGVSLFRGAKVRDLCPACIKTITAAVQNAAAG